MSTSAKTGSIVAVILVVAAAAAVALTAAPECREIIEPARVGAVAAGVAFRAESGHEPPGAPMDVRAAVDDEDDPEGGEALLDTPVLPGARPIDTVASLRLEQRAEPSPLPRLAFAPKTSPPDRARS